jgi:hypothetical protein
MKLDGHESLFRRLSILNGINFGLDYKIMDEGNAQQISLSAHICIVLYCLL